MPEIPEADQAEQDAVRAGFAGVPADKLSSLSDSELIEEGTHLARKLAAMDEGQLIGVASLLLAALLAVGAVLLARQGIKAVTGETHPTLSGARYVA
jgi:hypothetical protein